MGNCTMDRKRTADRILSIRTERGENQEQFANAVGVTGGTISHWESGRVVPNDSHKKRIAYHFGVTVEWLFFSEDEKRQFTMAEFKEFNVFESATRLRNERLKNNLTMEAVSKATGIKFHSVAQYEYGIASPPDEAKCKYADLFGVGIEYLFYQG